MFFLPGKIDKAVGEIGVAGGQRRLDILLDHSVVVPQSRIELEIGEFSRIVLRRQNGAGVARMRPQRKADDRAHRHARLPPNPSRNRFIRKSDAFATSLKFEAFAIPKVRRFGPAKMVCRF